MNILMYVSHKAVSGYGTDAFDDTSISSTCT